MKIHPPASLLASLFALITGAGSLSAQSATPESASATIELSPFVVNSTRDTGYQATSTLAGTRLDTPLKELGAAISVYTKDFLDDIGATSSNEFLVYATNMEASGPFGNASLSVADLNTALPFPDSLRENPQGSTRSRGLSAPTFTRDFFASMIEIDSYNTDRVTVLRGPNSALFGVSSPAGVTDTSLIRAELARNKNKVSFRYGNNGSMRSTVDFNRVLVPDQLALRLAGLQAREEYNQRPAYEAKERIFGALTYRPFKLTTLRANFESGRMRANRPNTVLPVDSIPNDWHVNGRPGFDWTFYDDPVRNPNAAAQNPPNFYPYYNVNSPFQAFTIFFNQPDDRAIGYSARVSVPATTGTAANSIKAQLLHPLLNRDLANDTMQYTSTRNINEFAAAQYWIGGNVLPGQLSGLVPAGLKGQGFTDFNAFDFKNRMLDETGWYADNFHASNIVLEQRAWDNRIGVEFAYDNQRADRRSLTTFFNGNNNGHIRIDTTVTLLNGLPNPNLGRPYASAGAAVRWTNQYTADETKRVNTYLKYDFKDLNDSWGAWLGSHTLSGMFERYLRDRIETQPRPMAEGVVAREINPAINARSPTIVAYLGPSLIGNSNPLKLNPIKVPALQEGPIGSVSSFIRPADATSLGGFQESPASLVNILGFGRVTREVIESKAATLQSYWLQNHVITMLGWRRDTDYFAATNGTFVSNPADSNDPGKVGWGFEDTSFPSTPPLNLAKETKSYSIVARWPQKWIKLPAGMDFSVFYNNAENFTPSAGRITPLGLPQPVPQGKTKEYGLNFSAFNEKLTIRVNRFETANTGLSASFGSITNLPVERYLVWGVEGNNNPQLVAMRNADIAKLLAPLPANYLQLYNAVITGTVPNLVGSRNSNLPGATDTTDLSATGTEIDIIYNPTSNWRILANVAHQETIRSNLLPHAKMFRDLMAPIYAELAGRASGNYPLGWTPGTPLPANVELFGPFVDRTVLVPFATALAAEGDPSAEQRNWRFNLITNYTFGRASMFGEMLKGWGIGGALRWQSRMVMGYPSSRNPDQSVAFDRSRPFHAPAETNVDAFVSYSRRIWDNRIDWKAQLNVTNLYTPRELIPIGVQPWGQPSSMRLAPERRWYLTNSFSF